MPYKKGPNNTLRYYNARNGRYENAPFSELLNHSLGQKQVRSKVEKEKIKREMLTNRARNSRDKYLFETFRFLENNIPGCVTMVNERLYHKKIKSTREIDFLTKNCIIEVKSGKVRHNTSQFIDQQDLSAKYNRRHVVYAPNITDKKLAELKNKGIDVVRTKKELLRRVQK